MTAASIIAGRVGRDGVRGFVPNKVAAIAIAVLTLLILIWVSFSTFENVDANEIVVIQSPFTGELNWYTTAGLKWQGFGKVTKYKKQDIYKFSTKIRFNDGAHGIMMGSIQYEMPLDPVHLTQIHTRFGVKAAVQKQLIETVVDKSIYMTGPLMSSKESYAEKRNALINDVEDQVSNGVYKTTQVDQQIKDPLTGEDKTITVVNILTGPNGLPLRQEAAALMPFGIKPFNFSITDLPYDAPVERQIQQQQQAAGAVQTAVANARKAEQDAITAEKNGQAAAATAKWQQEAIKAAAVTEAEKGRDVAKLKAEAAGYTKQEEQLLGEGEGAHRRAIMVADGGLTQKLETYKEVNRMYADAIGKYQGAWVPSIVMGGQGGSANGAASLIDMLQAKTARELALDMRVPGNTEQHK